MTIDCKMEVAFLLRQIQTSRLGLGTSVLLREQRI